MDKLLRARRLYEALTKGGMSPEDWVLARSPQYRELLALGVALCRELGSAEFDRLTEQLYGPADPRSEQAAPRMRHLWAGLSRLYGQDEIGSAKGQDGRTANEDYVILKIAMPRHGGRRLPKSDAGLTPRQGHSIKLH